MTWLRKCCVDAQTNHNTSVGAIPRWYCAAMAGRARQGGYKNVKKTNVVKLGCYIRYLLFLINTFFQI